MSRLYDDKATQFNAATGHVDSLTLTAFDPTDFGGEAAFKQKVDNSMVGNMRDCGECHVGGGGMEFLPRNPVDGVLDNADRVPYRYVNMAGTNGEVEVDITGHYGVTTKTFKTEGLGEGVFSSFNYYIDIFDDDNDGDHAEALYNDFAKTGVMEMDCLSCHLEGYSWEKRKEAVRAGRFDASRAYAAGIARINQLDYVTDANGAFVLDHNGEKIAKVDADGNPVTLLDADGHAVPLVAFTEEDANELPAGYGTQVAYDKSKLIIEEDGDGNITGIAWNLATSLKSTPPAENCASCHQGKYQVDWKKRGEMSPLADVHAPIGCMGCHQAKNLALESDMDGDFSKGKLGHDPAKGGAGPWDKLAQKLDKKDFKSCEDCHSYDGDLGSQGQAYGAPNPAGAHAAAGLTALITQGMDRDGVADSSHLDIISCEACHITKEEIIPHTMKKFIGVGNSEDGKVADDHGYISVDLTYATGGGFVDGSGPDHEGRLATHDTYEVSRPMMVNTGSVENPVYNSGFGYKWGLDNKIHPGNFLTSFFLRDKNDSEYDANVDGRHHGMDAILPTHIAEAIDYDPTKALFADGKTDVAEIKSYLANLSSKLPALNGQAAPTQGIKMKLSWVTVPFTMAHQISKADKAFGAGGCKDCHAPANEAKNGGFFNGTVDLQGFATVDMADAADGTKWADLVSPMTKANGGATPTYGHPNMKDKWQKMTLGLGSSLAPANRADALYEENFQQIAPAWTGVTITSGAITMPQNTSSAQTWKGWTLKVETCVDANSNLSCDTGEATDFATAFIGPGSGSGRFKHPDADPTAQELLDTFPIKMVTTFDYGFKVTANGDTKIDITPESGNLIRIHARSTSAYFNLADKVYKSASVKPVVPGIVTGEAISTRSQMVSYLEALGDVAEDYFLIGQDPVAEMGTIAGATASGGTSVIEVTADTTNKVALGTGATITGDVTYMVYNIATAGLDKETGEETGNYLDTANGEVLFDTPGIYRVIMSSTNVQGKIVKSAQYVKVVAPPLGSENIEIVKATGTATVSDIPAGALHARYSWDGGSTYDIAAVPTAGVGSSQVFRTPDLLAATGSNFRVNFYDANYAPLGSWNKDY